MQFVSTAKANARVRLATLVAAGEGFIFIQAGGASHCGTFIDDFIGKAQVLVQSFPHHRPVVCLSFASALHHQLLEDLFAIGVNGRDIAEETVSLSFQDLGGQLGGGGDGGLGDGREESVEHGDAVGLVVRFAEKHFVEQCL